MSNWDKVKQVPKQYLKEIKAGRMQGKSDINPMWRIKVMTETYGECGIGWYYEIDRQWIDNGSEGQVFAFCNVRLYVKDGDGWSAPIHGTGGSMLIAKEKAGLYSNDEAFKMALTDALSVAMKSLGVAADIYLGLWDGSKYRTDAPSQPAQPAQPVEVPKAVLDAALDEISNCKTEEDLRLTFTKYWGRFTDDKSRIRLTEVKDMMKDTLGAK